MVDSDIATQNSTAFTLADFQHASDALAGTTGSILDVWGGEYKFDNYHISLLQRMGKTVNGILSYGRNIQTIEQESDISTIYNSIIPYATVSQPSGDSSVDIIHVLSGSDYIQAGSYANQYPYPITLPVDFSDQFYASDASADEKQGKYAYSDAQLKALAQKYLSDNEVGKPTANMTVTAIDLSKSLEYQGTNEQPIELGDIVPTNYEPLAISGTAEVTQTIWDDITKQYVEYTFGQKQTLTSAMVSIADNAVSGVQKQVTAINTIINGLGQPDSYSGDPTAGYPPDPVLGQKFFLTDGNNQYIYQYSYDDVTGTYYWKELVSTYTGQEIDNKVSSVVSDAKSYTDDLNDSLTPQIADISSQADSAFDKASQAISSYAQVANQASSAYATASSAASDLATTKSSLASTQSSLAATASMAAKNGSDIASIKTDVSGLRGSFATTSGAVADLQVNASQASLDIANAKGDISSLQNTASQASIDMANAKGDISSLKSRADGFDGEFQNANGSLADLKLRADGFDATVTKVNNLQVGGTNLLQSTSSSLQSKTITTGTYWGDTNRYQDIPISIGQIYTFRVWLQCSTKNVLAHVKWLNSSKSEIAEFNGNQIALGDTGGYSTVTTGTAPANAVYARVETVRFPDDNGVAGDVVSYKEEKFEIGNMPTAWSPAPEDMATEADLLITSSEVATKVSEADFSTYQTQTASAIAAKVSNDSFASYQQQVADGFSQTVSTSTFNTLQTQVNNLGQTNLIANSDFNPDTGGWITWKNATLGTVLSNLHNVSGKNVMEITASTTGLGPRVISQPIPINSLNSTTSPTVSLSFAYYVFTGSTNYFQIQYLDDAGTDMGYAGAVALSGTGWQAYVLQNKTLTIPTGATHIALLFDARANGKLGIAMPMLVNGSTIGSYVAGPYVGQTSAQSQTVEAITDFVTDGNGNIGTSFLTAFEKTSLMTGWDGSSSIFNQTSSQINLAVNGIQVGGRNLVLDTSNAKSQNSNGTINQDTYNQYVFANPISTWGSSGQVLTLSFNWSLTTALSSNATIGVFFNESPWLGQSFTLPAGQTSGTISAQFTLTQAMINAAPTGLTIRLNSSSSVTIPSGNTLTETNFKLEKGNKATDWSAAPEDLTTNSQLLAEINIQAGTTLIQNDKIYLNASSIVFGGTAFINDAMVTDLSASKLTAGTIDASKITVINLDANNISANASAFFTTQWESNYGQYLSITASEIDFITSSNTAKINSSGFTVYQGSGQFGFNVTKWGDSSGGTTSSYGTYMGTYTSNGFLAFTGNGIGSTLVWMDSGMSKGSQVGELGAWNFYRDILVAPDASNTNQSRQLSFFGTNYGIKADNYNSSLNFYTQNHFWFSHKIVVNGSVASTSLLSLKTIIGEMGTTEAIDDILATDIEKYYFNDDPDQVTQLSPIIDDVNSTPKYSIPDIINNGDSVNIYAMASMSWLAIKQFAAELGDSTIKGTALLDGKNIKANSLSIGSIDSNYMFLDGNGLNLSNNTSGAKLTLSGSEIDMTSPTADNYGSAKLGLSSAGGMIVSTFDTGGSLVASSMLGSGGIEILQNYGTQTGAISTLSGNSLTLSYNNTSVGINYYSPSAGVGNIDIGFSGLSYSGLITLNGDVNIQSNGGNSFALNFPNIDETNGQSSHSNNRIYSIGNYMQIQGSGGNPLQVGTDGTQGGRIWSMSFYNRTYSSGSTVTVTSSGTLGRITSARKYKLDDRTADDLIAHADKILSIQPKTWFDKAEVEAVSSELAGKQEAPEEARIKSYYGFIADDFDDAGLKEVVLYNEQGGVEGLQYDRITTYHNVILKEHEDKLANLQQRVTELENEIKTLKAA
ncbi:peptidase [Oenococcus oeni]|uniref:phage tail spike protein n=1 Tax=Oenococcus oeni TaxID=1247 RepID=UPI0008F8D3F6|nr:phage tail spike protein [Oenococcus oeni]OIL67657.1 peptidase [Oenococcus oeni]